MAYNTQCDPLENNINSPLGPPLPGMPGFGLDINFPMPPMPNLGIPEDIINLLRRLKFKLPGGGLLQGLVDSLTKKVSEILSTILSYLNAAMGWIMWVMAIVEMILCVIKVLCAAPKPFSIVRAVKRLLRKCIPIFITICFPFLVWLLMLLALIAILIALIEYIIAMIIRLIKQIIKNMKRLYNLTFKQRSPNAALAIIAKLANLLCLFQSIFEFLAIIFGLLDIITGQWAKILKVCDRGNPGGTEDDDVCAEFMRDPVSQPNANKEIYISKVGTSFGEAWYCNQVFGQPFPFLSVATVVPVRNEVVYLKDDALSSLLSFNNIITSNGFTFFPFDKTITKDINDDQKPYFVDLYVTCDPGDGYGSRKIQIKDVTVTNVTTSAIKYVTGSVVGMEDDAKGYLSLSGGKSVDSYGLNNQTIEYILGQKAKSPASNIGDPTYDNGTYISYTNIQYVLKINFDALAEYSLITVGCFPSIQADQAMNNATFNKVLNFALPDFVTLPDVETALNGMVACLANYRKNITIDTTTTFGDCMLAIMNDLNDQAAASYCQLLIAAIDIYNAGITIDTTLQFVGKTINVTVTPKDITGRTLEDMIGGFDPPKSCTDSIAKKFDGYATLGEVSDFSYDGYGNFIAGLTSQVGGNGVLTVSFEGNTIKLVTRPDDPGTAPSMADLSLAYTFIGKPSITGYVPEPRRDESDTANNG